MQRMVVFVNLHDLTLHEAHEKITNKEISAKDLLDSVYERIDNVENKVNSYITLSKEKAYKEAEEVDKSIAKGLKIGDLAGIPMAVKDNICTKSVKTTCASKMLEKFIPPYNSEAYERLLKAGAVMIGKTNMDEFAMGSSTENSYYKITKNPWNLNKVPGGSSGGSAAAVAAGEAFYALGSDTGGSIRQPATFCGVVGFKPTYGAVSRYGTVAYAPSLEQVGVLTKDVKDCAIVLNHLYGYDEKDSTTINMEHADFQEALKEDIKGMRIGLPKEYYGDGIGSEIKDSIKNALKLLESLGAYVEETELNYAEYALPVYYIIALSEASSSLARFDGIRYGYKADDYRDLDDMYIKSRSQGFGDEVKLRILYGIHSLIGENYKNYYDKALRVRRLVKEDFNKAFQKYDLLITPTYPTAAFEIGEKIKDKAALFMGDLCTVPVNVAGIPAMSVPCGFTGGSLPIGMQIMGRPFGEAKMLRAAYAYEKCTEHLKQRPKL